MELFINNTHQGTFDDHFVLLQHLDREGISVEDVTIKLSKREKRLSTRKKIQQRVADSESLNATTNDAALISMQILFSLIRSLEEVSSLDELRESVKPYALIAKGFVERIETQETQLPFQIKGLEKTIKTIEKRATAVASILETTTYKEGVK